MNDFIAYPSRWRIASLILGSIVFVIGGLLMVGASDSPAVIVAVGWLCVIFFGLCALAWTKSIFETREQLRIGPAGIYSAQSSDQTIPWSEIADISVWSFQKQKSIILHLRDPARFPARGIASIFAAGNRMLTGGHIAITLTGTDREFDDAMLAISHFRP
jgi:hypothetical protein